MIEYKKIPSEFIVPPEKEGERLDQWIAEELSELSSRSEVQKWIKNGNLQLLKGAGSAIVKANHRVRTGELFRLEVPEPEEITIAPENLGLVILSDDPDFAVIHKPPGIAVHPGTGDRSTTIVSGLLYTLEKLSAGSEKNRPGIVHRLDKPTEGILVVAKTDYAHRKLARQFQERTVEKEYAAWLLSAPAQGEGTIDLPLKRHPHDRSRMRIDPTGRKAVTHYKISKVIISRKGRKYAFAEIRIETGRTHQIRVHFSHTGSPVVGDPLYSRSAKEFEKYGLLLFAKRLKFAHPRTGESLEFELPLPQRFLDFEKKCEFL